MNACYLLILETLPPLQEALTKFYSEARNESGDLYKKNTLTNTRYGINRFLSEKKFDIIKDHAFVNSNKMFKVMTVQLKREGKGGIDHHPPIEANDFDFFLFYLENYRPNILPTESFH